jgi:hypothetical protein
MAQNSFAGANGPAHWIKESGRSVIEEGNQKVNHE